MKEIINKKMVEVEEVKFVADDGKEFIVDEKHFRDRKDAERECSIHENTIKGNALEGEYKRMVIDRLNIGNSVAGFFDGDDIFMEKIHLEKEADLYTVLGYFRHYSTYMEEYTEFNKFEYPCDAMVFGRWDSYIECRPLKDFPINAWKKEATRFLGITAEDLEIKK